MEKRRKRSRSTRIAEAIEPHVSRAKGKVRDALKQIGRKVAERLKAAWIEQKLAKDDVNSDTDALVRRLISEAAPDSDFLTVPSFIGAELERQFKDSGYAALVPLGLGDDTVSTDFVDAGAVDYAKARGAELVGKRVLEDGSVVDNPNAAWSINDSTRDMLRSTVTQGVEEGWSADTLASEIEDATAFGEARAETIARTELAFAATAANRDVAHETGAVAKRSLLGSEHDDDVPDGDECDDAADADVIGIDEEFVPGYQNAPFHPKCVCDTEYIYADDERAADFV
jgi:hypothetical protein